MRSSFSSVLLMCSCVAFNAEAGTITVLQNQDAVVSINAELGSILQLPSAVSTVTSSKYFYITDIASSMDAQNGVKTDVRKFQVKPVFDAQSENVTFVMADGKNISFKFIPARAGDKFYDIHFEQSKKPSKVFFSHEMSLMKSMILDENGGYVRDVTDEKIVTQFENFEFKLIRVYASSDFTGYVFTVTNEASEPQFIDLSTISFGLPNRAIMSHVDQEELATCPLLSVAQDCVTRLHVITRGNTSQIHNQSLSILSSTPPFVKSDDVMGGES